MTLLHTKTYLRPRVAASTSRSIRSACIRSKLRQASVDPLSTAVLVAMPMTSWRIAVAVLKRSAPSPGDLLKASISLRTRLTSST